MCLEIHVKKSRYFQQKKSAHKCAYTPISQLYHIGLPFPGTNCDWVSQKMFTFTEEPWNISYENLLQHTNMTMVTCIDEVKG